MDLFVPTDGLGTPRVERNTPCLDVDQAVIHNRSAASRPYCLTLDRHYKAQTPQKSHILLITRDVDASGKEFKPIQIGKLLIFQVGYKTNRHKYEFNAVLVCYVAVKEPRGRRAHTKIHAVYGTLLCPCPIEAFKIQYLLKYCCSFNSPTGKWTHSYLSLFGCQCYEAFFYSQQQLVQTVQRDPNWPCRKPRWHARVCSIQLLEKRFQTKMSASNVLESESDKIWQNKNCYHTRNVMPCRLRSWTKNSDDLQSRTPNQKVVVNVCKIIIFFLTNDDNDLQEIKLLGNDNSHSWS